jgi:hypothetical protein
MFDTFSITSHGSRRRRRRVSRSASKTCETKLD